MAETQPQPPALSPFTFSPTLSEFNVPMKTYLSSPALRQHQAIASGALIFSPSNKILIIQRAPNDSAPNKWEIPGGGVDTDDATILHGVAREVFEETGLNVTHIKRLVGSGEGFAFMSSRGLRIVKFAFEVEVVSGEEVKLDVKEHQKFLWASEEECRSGLMEDGYEINFTGKAHQNCILEGWRLRKEDA
ncbi:NUDIX hydrolase domain-like protein [Rhexocercosporidium sp. MPI-PUGE-AT-0058]|nr:NUDIX hydrolase domain-like protein [Rhexocercosporidium sp. MPI-PUGE-AT-0058]